ncbi:MAG: glycoside hydrolase family 5 protein, partial [Acetobacteraceae bacterium]
WRALQARVLAAIRAALPRATVILTGADWSSIAGLQAAIPPADTDVIYDVHFYDPAELTSLAAYRHGLDRAALARLPFPMIDPAHCRRVAHSADPATAALIGFVCAQHWDAPHIARQFATVAAWGRRTGVPVILGEFGASARLNRPARLDWVATVRRAAEHERLGWALWGYDDVMGFDLPRPPPTRPALDPGLLQALGLKPASEHRAQ